MESSNPKIRMTRQRRMILDQLLDNHNHPSADEIYKAVRQDMPHISLGTVYRNLDILSDAGMIRKLDLGCSEMHFDGDLNEHYHIRCHQCGKVEDVPMEPINHIEDLAKEKIDYDIYGHTLEFCGVCPRCKAKLNRLSEERSADGPG